MTKVTSKKSGNRLLDSTELMPEILFIFSDKSGKSKFNKLPRVVVLIFARRAILLWIFASGCHQFSVMPTGAIYFHRLQNHYPMTGQRRPRKNRHNNGNKNIFNQRPFICTPAKHDTPVRQNLNRRRRRPLAPNCAKSCPVWC